MLSNFQVGEHAMVQLFLLGQPEFKTRLDSAPELEQLRQRVIATHHLTAMEIGEIAPYIEHRMKLVGWTGNPALADSAVEPLYRYSGGIPRKINNIMTRILLMGSVDRREVIDGALVGAVIADLARDTTSPNPAVASTQAAPSLAMDSVTLDLAARIAMLESHADEQGVALRRVLNLLVDWAESEAPQPKADFFRAPSA